MILSVIHSDQIVVRLVPWEFLFLYRRSNRGGAKRRPAIFVRGCLRRYRRRI